MISREEFKAAFTGVESRASYVPSPAKIKTKPEMESGPNVDRLSMARSTSGQDEGVTEGTKTREQLFKEEYARRVMDARRAAGIIPT